MGKPKAKKNKSNHVIAKPKTRKELRKEKKLQKKENKRNYFSNAGKLKNIPGPLNNKQTQKPHVGLPPPPGNLSNDGEDIPSDFSDAEVDAKMSKSLAKPKGNKNKQKVVKNLIPDAAERHRRENAKLKDLERASHKQRIKQLKEANEEEDKIISRLEKKLKMNKSKDKKRLVQKMFDDGLDYALELCLDDDDDSKKKPSKSNKKKTDDDFDESDFGDDDGDFGEESDEEAMVAEGEKGSSDEGLSDDVSGEEEETPRVKEDIYGRKRDVEGNIIQETNIEPTAGKYIPPHQRAASSAAETGNRREKLDRLRKNCKGFLNRLSENNLHNIANSIEKLYMSTSRHDMNETLYTLLSEALLTKSLCKERMVQEHIVLLAYLHASVGQEIGAHFLQMFINKFVDHLRDVTTKTDVENKELNNLILVLSYLYMFKVFEHNLLLELIDRLGDNLCEKTVECLLLIFQSVGFKLRKDDPLAFKSMMQGLQKKISESPMEMKENLRLKFMVDILNAVKNNNINKIPQFDPELGENLRKKLKAMLTNDKYVITLKITIDDLLRADEVGKWWIVGSAWSGNIKDINSANKQPSSTLTQERFSDKLIALAKQQRMNTEERKNIFCIVMSAEDFVDAFEKILHLSLKDQRSIAYVILHCSLNEKQYNPYYAHLAQKFCQHNRKFQLAFQFASWDRINDIDALNKAQIKHLAKFLLHLILHGGLALSMLKVVNFVDLNKSNFILMKDIMVGILLTPESDCRQVFEKIAKNIKLNAFKNSIRLFMQHFLLKNEASLKLDEDKMDLLKRRIDTVDKVLAYVDL